MKSLVILQTHLPKKRKIISHSTLYSYQNTHVLSSVSGACIPNITVGIFCSVFPSHLDIPCVNGNT